MHAEISTLIEVQVGYLEQVALDVEHINLIKTSYVHEISSAVRAPAHHVVHSLQ